ncbi:MAG: choice-of-anchor tandem repeat GloVer-containing protein [Thermoanaerobaculia bacterium]
MSSVLGCAGAVVVTALFCGSAMAATHVADPTYSILHTFQGAESNPHSSVVSDGRGNLYGTTFYGGSSNCGTIYTVRTDGTDFRLLHTFDGGLTDGSRPAASLILDGSGNLYGTTVAGGASDFGTIFTMRTDGGDFQVLHAFAGGANDGKGPYSPLTLGRKGFLYGTTACAGGASTGGTVFKVGTDGAGFGVLHSFQGGVADGRCPGALLLDESGEIFGATAFGGQPAISTAIGTLFDGFGTIFKIRTDGMDFQLLRAFQEDPNAPIESAPSGPASLITDGSGILYGVTVTGGPSTHGTVFSVKMDGSGFQILHAFAGGAADGEVPVALVLDRLGNLYGLTQGENSAGVQATVFRLRTDGAGYVLLRTFVDTRDGIVPSDLVLLDDLETLYGTMAFGGPSSAGTLFSIRSDGSVFQVLHAFAGLMSDGSLPSASVISDGSGYLYGTTYYGGNSNGGTVFRMRPDGAGFQVLYAFSGGVNDGARPEALLLDRRGTLYGTTLLGGSADSGTIFKLRTDGTGFQLLHDFVGGVSDGLHPATALVLESDNLYGTTPNGGPSDAGIVFTLKSDGTHFRLLHSFTFTSADDGAAPSSSLVLDGSGNLYGTTGYGGTGRRGIVFRLRTDGTGFQLLHSFGGGAADGSDPSGSLTLDGSGNIYGTTTNGGLSGAGAIFKMRTDGASFQLVHSFNGDATEGYVPNAPLILDGLDNLYGTNRSGGSSGGGTIFTVRTDGTGFRTLHAFGDASSDGRNPRSSLLMDGLGTLLGTTSLGGSAGFGTVFSLSIGRDHPVVTTGPFVPVRRH